MHLYVFIKTISVSMRKILALTFEFYGMVGVSFRTEERFVVYEKRPCLNEAKLVNKRGSNDTPNDKNKLTLC